MKQQSENIEREVGKTLRLLDELKPLEVHHLFRVRLMQRVEAEFGEGAKKESSGFSRYFDVRLALMALLLVINLSTALLSLKSNTTQFSAGISELLDNMGDDYSTQEFAYYDQSADTGTD
ncbi:hypothetical protein, partial [Chlorobium ferrooxidans]|uniref:hypothetical protein n=1 Tax=Chlorobium ferrooxidans TaxID=84205 RepID=UPI00058FC1A5